MTTNHSADHPAEQTLSARAGHEAAVGAAAAVRARRPLVHCLSATVSMSLVADGLLAAGASPMMTETAQEAPTMTALADAALINLGTLSTDGMEGIPATVRACVELDHPWVLDPAAAGVAPVRTVLARDLLRRRPDVVRANASEVLALVGSSGGRGADSIDAPEDAAAAAAQVARTTGGTVAVSGPKDLITDGRHRWRLERGTPMLTRVTGTGCLLGALVAACLGAGLSPHQAAVGASAWLAVAGERAASSAEGIGSFRVALLDHLDQVGR